MRSALVDIIYMIDIVDEAKFGAHAGTMAINKVTVQSAARRKVRAASTWGAVSDQEELIRALSIVSGLTETEVRANAASFRTPALLELLLEVKVKTEHLIDAAARHSDDSNSSDGVATPSTILRLAKQQSDAFRADLIEKGLVATSSEMCEALGFTRQALSKAVKEHRIFRLRQGFQSFYPVFYADPTISRSVLEEVTKALGSITGGEKWQFFTRPKASLTGKTPLEAIRAGDVDQVLLAAAAFIER